MKKQSKKKASPSRKPIGSEILVNVILDRSGSMASNREGTISGYNEYLGGLRKDDKTKYFISLTQFDAPSDGPELTVSYLDKPLTEIQDLAEKDYEPRGMTPLYDAIGEITRRVTDTKGRPVLAVVITDGLENASREFTKDAIRALIKDKEKEGWTWAFLGANIDSYTVGTSLGVSAKNISNYAPGLEAQLYTNMAASTRAFASARAATGTICQMSNENLFTDAQRASMGDPVVTAPIAVPTVLRTVGTAMQADYWRVTHAKIS